MRGWCGHETTGAQACRREQSSGELERVENMGETFVDVVVRNPAQPTSSWESAFLVDTGSIDCLAPMDRLEAIGLVPRGQRTYSLANGSQITMPITVAELELAGETIGVTIVMAPEGTESLLGLTAMESAGLAVDPSTQELFKRPSINLKESQERTNGRFLHEETDKG